MPFARRMPLTGTRPWVHASALSLSACPVRFEGELVGLKACCGGVIRELYRKRGGAALAMSGGIRLEGVAPDLQLVVPESHSFSSTTKPLRGCQTFETAGSTPRCIPTCGSLLVGMRATIRAWNLPHELQDEDATVPGIYEVLQNQGDEEMWANDHIRSRDRWGPCFP